MSDLFLSHLLKVLTVAYGVSFIHPLLVSTFTAPAATNMPKTCGKTLV